jgi:predicted translin family RNA/ssDNA-binding protein
MRPQDRFGQKKDPMAGQGDVYNQLANAPQQQGQEDFTNFEVDAANRRNELLFSITSQIEETRGKLKQAELLVERLRQSLREYEEMYKTLTKGKGKEK